jgi:bile acid-coenzyme A ligase
MAEMFTSDSDLIPAARVPIGQRISDLANERRDKTAITMVAQDGTERGISWLELDQRSNQVARLLTELGVAQGRMVVIGLPNSIEHFLVNIAAWKLGACTLPLKASLPQRERDQIIELADPAVVASVWPSTPRGRLLGPSTVTNADRFSSEPLPIRLPDPGKAIASGGSTGRSKIIVSPGPLDVPVDGPTGAEEIGVGRDQVQLVAGGLYHNSPFSCGNFGLAWGHALVVMEKFDASLVLDLIERHRVQFVYMAPIMMKRVMRVPGIADRDLSSLEALYHTAAPCPPWLKRAWIELIGPERVYEAFGSTEDIGSTVIRVEQWLAHCGSVCVHGNGELHIRAPDVNTLPTGKVGEIYTRRFTDQPTYNYIGSPPARALPDGFSSVGDLGWLDEAGYLYLADRRTDLIISGGANVYPAEVEGALTEHAGVADVAVIGLPDEEWGRRVHAVVLPVDPAKPPERDDLDRHVRQYLASYKAPKTYEFVTDFPRDEAGKIRRSALVAERVAEDQRA